MTAPTIRDEVLAAWASYFVREGCARDVATTLALAVEQIMIGHGAPGLPRRPRPEDPNAAGLKPPAAAPPPDTRPLAEAVRAELRPYAGPDKRADHPPTDHLPALPKDTA